MTGNFVPHETPAHESAASLTPAAIALGSLTTFCGLLLTGFSVVALLAVLAPEASDADDRLAALAIPSVRMAFFFMSLAWTFLGGVMAGTLAPRFEIQNAAAAGALSLVLSRVCSLRRDGDVDGRCPSDRSDRSVRRIVRPVCAFSLTPFALPPDQCDHVPVMIDYFRQLIARVRRSRGPLFPFGPFMPPGDPYSSVREPVRRSPGGRSSAIAVAEPDPPVQVRAISQPSRKV